MGIVALKKPVSESAALILREALARVESGETSEVTVLEEGCNSLSTTWSGSNDLFRVAGHLARMQYIVQKRMGEEY